MNINEIENARSKMQHLEPSTIIKYLEDNGWKEEKKINNGLASIWKQKKEGKNFSVLVPLERRLSDFDDRMYDLIRTLVISENRTFYDIVNSVININKIAEEKKREILSLKFQFIYEPEKRDISAKSAGIVLVSLQDLVSSIGQVKSGKVSKTGKIQQDIVEATELSVVETFKGSFGINLGLPQKAEQLDLFGNTLTDNVLTNFLNLINYSNDPDKEKLKTELLEIKKFSASRFRKFLMSIVNSNANLYAIWGSINSDKGGRAELKLENAINTIEFINKMELEAPEEYDINGELVSATKHKDQTNTIEIVDIKDKKKYVGKLIRNIDIDLTIERFYKAKIQEISLINPTTGEEKTEYTIMELSFQ